MTNIMSDVHAQLERLFYTPVVTAQLSEKLQDEIEAYYAPYIAENIFPEQKDLTQVTDYYNEREYDIHSALQEIIIKLSRGMIGKELFRSDEVHLDTVRISDHWIQNYKVNHHHITHQHPNAVIAGTYMLRSNNKGSPLMLQNPESTRSFITSTGDFYEIAPRRGCLCLFPAWIHHQVPPNNNSDTVRTIISFNIKVDLK